MSVRTTEEFKRLPVGKVCSVYFHAIDIVLDRQDRIRQAWTGKVHLPKMLFHPKKGRRGCRTSSKRQDYVCFKRMLAVKDAVYANHTNMLRLYEKYCSEAETMAYWGEDDDDDAMEELAPADATNEQDCVDEF